MLIFRAWATCVQTSSIYWKTAIKDGFEEMEHEFPFATFRPYTHTYTVPHTMTFIVAPQIKKGFSAPILHVEKKNDNGQLN